MSQLTQIQLVKRLNPKAKEVFIYHNDSGGKDYLPFRVGDIVRVTDWGEVYPRYFEAFRYFTKSSDYPYYSSSCFEEKEKRREDGDKQLFKIIKIAQHKQDESILCYIQDRFKHGVVIGRAGLKLVKQFPLRKNETINIVLERISQLPPPKDGGLPQSR